MQRGPGQGKAIFSFTSIFTSISANGYTNWAKRDWLRCKVLQKEKILQNLKLAHEIISVKNHYFQKLTIFWTSSTRTPTNGSLKKPTHWTIQNSPSKRCRIRGRNEVESRLSKRSHESQRVSKFHESEPNKPAKTCKSTVSRKSTNPHSSTKSPK